MASKASASTMLAEGRLWLRVTTGDPSASLMTAEGFYFSSVMLTDDFAAR